MEDPKELWYQVGYSLESLRRRLPDLRKEATPSTLFRSLQSVFSGDTEGFSEMFKGVALSLAPTVLQSLPRWDDQAPHLLRGGAAGAGAALVVTVTRPVLRGHPELPELNETLLNDLLAGVGRGLLYAGAVEAHLPGSSWLRGLTYGALDGVLTPFGGAGGVFGSQSPHHRIPILGPFVDPSAGAPPSFPESLLFGVTLGLLYGDEPDDDDSADPESSGITPER